MIGALEQATHRKWGPVLIAAYFNSTPEPFAIVYTTTGDIKKAGISDLSAHWHYDSIKAKFVPDFPEDENLA